MPSLSDLSHKQFSCECRGISPAQLLACVDQALAAAPTAAAAKAFVQADWDPWQILGPARPDDGLRWTRNDGTVIPMPGYAFEAFTRYRERQISAAGNFGSQGALQLFCSAGSATEEDHTSLLLGFSDNPAMPMWRTYASELAVHETVKTIAEFLRQGVFGGLQEPILGLISGGWVNRIFAGFGDRF